MERTRMAQKKGTAEKGTSAAPAWGLLSLEQQAALYLLSLKDQKQLLEWRRRGLNH